MSALPPKADLLGKHGKGPLLTQSGHGRTLAIPEAMSVRFGMVIIDPDRVIDVITYLRVSTGNRSS